MVGIFADHRIDHDPITGQAFLAKSARWQLAVTPKATGVGILFRNSPPSGIIMQHAIVCGTGLLFASERRGWCTMIFVWIRFAAQDRSDHENGG
jgi:hypothetical protein